VKHRLTAQTIWSEIQLRKNRKDFSHPYAILSFGKCPNNGISDFQMGDMFLIKTVLN